MAKTMDDMETVIVAVCDLNGLYRGKRLPGSQIKKALKGAVRMPLSVTSVDIWGRDIEGSQLVFETGDADGICQPTGVDVIPCPWLGAGTGFLPLWMSLEDGTPHPADPRQALAAIVARYTAKGLRPVVATELEFYLTPRRDTAGFDVENTLSVTALEALTPFFNDVYAACEVQGIPVDAAISECGAGQFEINLLHKDDPLGAADDAKHFQRLIKGFAEAHGYDATFMAKPFGTAPGSGLHVHFSLLDEAGSNVFDDGTQAGSDVMRWAVGGLTAAMGQSTLIFAPHQNSYRRVRPDSHAPTAVAWGYENRTAAIRIPGGPGEARRIEHRVAGADANPYLVLAAILGAALIGIERELKPEPATTGNSYDADLPQLPLDWVSAIAEFEDGDLIPDIFDPMLIQLFTQMKRQEMHRFLDVVSEFETETYRGAI